MPHQHLLPCLKRQRLQKKGYSWWTFQGRHSCYSWSSQTPPEYKLPMLMPIGKYAASGQMLPLLSFDEVPTLPPIDPPVGHSPLRKNRTAAPTPPRIIGLCSDVYNQLDHTSPHHPLPPRSFIAAAATAMPGKKSVISGFSRWQMVWWR